MSDEILSREQIEKLLEYVSLRGDSTEELEELWKSHEAMRRKCEDLLVACTTTTLRCVQEEREACARVADKTAAEWDGRIDCESEAQLCREIAKGIRERG